MENGISLSEYADQLLKSDKNLKFKLDEFCQMIAKKNDAELSICQIYGKRWSFLAGSYNSYSVKSREKINESYGLIYEKDKLSKKQLQQIENIVVDIIDSQH